MSYAASDEVSDEFLQQAAQLVDTPRLPLFLLSWNKVTILHSCMHNLFQHRWNISSYGRNICFKDQAMKRNFIAWQETKFKIPKGL